MAKKRQYTITSGIYDSYRIVTRVEGNQRPALSTLHRQFSDTYMPLINRFDRTDNKFWELRQESREKLKADGYSTSFASAFVEWLIKCHGFTELKSDEFWVDE